MLRSGAKRKTRKRIWCYSILVTLSVLILFFIYLGQVRQDVDKIETAAYSSEADLVDSEKTAAFIDLFELTYLRVYLKTGKEARSVEADGIPLDFNDEANRWELVSSDYKEGDQVTIKTVRRETGEEVQVINISVQSL